MTMVKAVLLLVLSGVVMVAGIIAVAFKVDAGTVNSNISSGNAGARLGDNPATPTGPDHGVPGGGNVGATITAAVQLGTAFARTAVAQDTPAPSGSVTAAAIGEPVEAAGARFTVHQVADPEPPGIFTTSAGNRRVAIELSEEAVTGSLAYSFSQFRLRGSDGKDYTWTITNSKPEFGQGSLPAGQAKRGWISFQLPVGVDAVALVLQPVGQRNGVVLTNLK